MAAILTLGFLKAQAAKRKGSDFDHFLSMVPDVPAQTGDKRMRALVSMHTNLWSDVR